MADGSTRGGEREEAAFLLWFRLVLRPDALVGHEDEQQVLAPRHAPPRLRRALVCGGREVDVGHELELILQSQPVRDAVEDVEPHGALAVPRELRAWEAAWRGARAVCACCWRLRQHLIDTFNLFEMFEIFVMILIAFGGFGY